LELEALEHKRISFAFRPYPEREVEVEEEEEQLLFHYITQVTLVALSQTIVKTLNCQGW